MKNIKKIVAMLLAVMMVASFCACNANTHFNNSSSQTYNGITMTETTTTVNGESKTTVEYTDADGNVLDPEIGAAAFEAAKNGDQHALETVTAAQATEQPAEATEAPAAEAAQDESFQHATIVFANETGEDFTELYLTVSTDSSWGTNVLGDEPLETGSKVTFKNGLTYSPDSSWDLKFVTADGESHEVKGFDFSGLDDPENIVLTFTMDDAGFHIHIA